jgi:energy-coupling factor transporter ATP-binding protein EcfA2
LLCSTPAAPAAENIVLTHPGDAAFGPILKPWKRNKIAQQWFTTLDVRPNDIGQNLERFSGGNQQKVVLAKWLSDPELRVLVLDHPLRGLDPGAAETVNEQIKAACKKGTAVILLADTLEEALEMGDDVVVMRDGVISATYDLSVDNPSTLDLLERKDGVEEPISSTAIRRALRGGEIDTATALLGHSFEVRGPVVTGDQRGRTIGFATANVQVPGFICLPADGVYAGIYTRPSGERYACAINLGRRPTFYEHSNSSLLEAHLIDESIDLYGEDAKVQFTHFLRSERKFNGPDALIAQVKLDVDHARELIKSLPPGTRP